MKIASYNIKDGGIGREPLIMQVIEQINADVLLLQEVVYPHLLEEISKKNRLFYYIATGNSKRNIAIMSKYQFSSINSYHPFSLKHTLLEAKIKKGNEEISFFGIHLAPYPFLFFEIWRLVEISIILSRIKRIEKSNSILCGDFNSVAPNDTVSLNHFPKWMQLILVLTQAGIFPSLVIRKVVKSGFVDCQSEFGRNDLGFTLPALDPNVRHKIRTDQEKYENFFL